MNGSSKKKDSKKNIWRRSFYGVTLIYILVVSILAIGAYELPNIYGKMDQYRVNALKGDLKQALKTGADDEKRDILAQFSDENNIDLIVLNDQGFSYFNTESSNIEEAREQLNEHSLSYQSYYTLSINKIEYQIFIAVYQMEPQLFFEFVIFLLIISVLVLFILLSVLIFIMFKKLVDPIKRLRNNILKMKKYQFGDVEHELGTTEYDAISEELREFTDDLQGKMQDIGISYTRLEQSLQSEKEKLIYKDQSIGAMVHNLKAPAGIALYYLEQLIDESKDAEQTRKLQKVLLQNQLLFDEMKEIVRVTHESDFSHERELIDIVEIAKFTMQRFISLLKEKNIIYYLDTPSELKVWMDQIELKQLLQNIISNAVQYAPNGTSIDLAIFEEDGYLHIEVYNEVDDISKIDFERVFELFYSAQGKQEGHGTGVGMYTIKQTVAQYNGTCSFKPFEEGVLLKLLIPLVGDSDEN